MPIKLDGSSNLMVIFTISFAAYRTLFEDSLYGHESCRLGVWDVGNKFIPPWLARRAVVSNVSELSGSDHEKKQRIFSTHRVFVLHANVTQKTNSVSSTQKIS